MRLELQVRGTAPRVDRSLETHRALVYDFTLEPAERYPGGYQEAVALDTGHLLQRIGFCPEASDRCSVSAGDVLFPTSSTPGVMGTGPLLANHDATDSLGEGAVTALGEGDRPAMDRARMAEATANRTCVTRSVSGPTGGVLAPTALVPEGSMAVCEELPVPAWFDTRAGTTFALVEGPHVRDDVPPPAQGSKDAPTVDLPARNEWTPPLLAAAEPHPSPFPLEEAHEAALEKSETYAAFHEENEDALVVASDSQQPGSAAGTVARKESHEHEVFAATPDGEGYRVLLEKEITYYGPEETGTAQILPLVQEREEEIKLLEKGPLVWDQAPSPDSAAPRQVHTWAAINVSEVLADRPWHEDSGVFITSSLRPGGTHRGWDGEPVDLEDGYMISVKLKGPELGPSRTLLLPFQYDGPTGDLRWATVEVDQLPFGLR